MSDSRNITKTLVEDVRVGMVRVWNGVDCTIVEIAPEGSNYVRITYRSPKHQWTSDADASHYNRVSVRARKGTCLSIAEGGN